MAITIFGVTHLTDKETHVSYPVSEEWGFEVGMKAVEE